MIQSEAMLKASRPQAALRKKNADSDVGVFFEVAGCCRS